MANLNASQIAQYAFAAGFRAQGLTMAVAIALAESGGNPTVVNLVGDTGLWQINQPIHSQYSKSWLQNPANNAKAAFTISSGGSNWRPWCTAYSDAACGTKGGAFLGSGSPYQKFMSVATQATSGVSSATKGSSLGTPAVPAGPWVPAYLKQMGDWIKNPNTFIFGRWQGHPEGGYEGGMDLGSPGGTPVLALASGTIQGAGYFCHGGPYFNPNIACANGAPGYGVVTTRVNVPGAGLQDLYYQHIDIDPSIKLCSAGNCGGQTVVKGQRIGTIRSNVGMLEMGFNAQWGTIWGGSHPGPWVDDPRPWVKALMMLGPPGSSNTGSSTPFNPSSLNFGTSGVLGPIPTYTPLLDQIHETLINSPGFYGIALALDESEKFPGWVDLTRPTQDINIMGIDTGFAPPDINGEVRSIGATITDNFVPFAIRNGLTLLGGILLISLLIRLTEQPLKQVIPLLVGVE